MKGRTGTVAALVAAAALGLWLACGRSAAKEAVYPVESGRTWFARGPVAGLKAMFRPARTASENRRLHQEVAALRMRDGDVERVAAENERLRRALGFQKATNGGWICAPVLARDGAAGVRGMIRVGRGSADGVTTNAAVAVPEGLVGRVEQVSRRTADVRLITSPQVRVSCEIDSGDPSLGPVYGVLEGGGARAVGPAAADASVLYVVNPLRARHLKRRPSLPPRAKVTTSGLGGVFPRGIVVGFLIDGCEEDDAPLEREGGVEPAVDFPSLEDVFIRRED